MFLPAFQSFKGSPGLKIDLTQKNSYDHKRLSIISLHAYKKNFCVRSILSPGEPLKD